MASAVTAEISASRVARVQDALCSAGADVLILGAGSNTRYLWGYGEGTYERFCAAFVGRQQEPVFVVPRMSLPNAYTTLLAGHRVVAWDDSDGPVNAIEEALRLVGVQPGVRVALDDALKVSWALEIGDVLHGNATFQQAAAILGPVRAVKEPDEQRVLIDAGERTWACWNDPQVRLHRLSESHAAEVLSTALRQCGASDTFAIVASGRHTASPHHQSGDEVIGDGLLLCDFGGCFDGYWSDITVTLALGHATPHQVQVYHAVWRAWHDAVLAVRPGVSSSDIDHAAWSVLEREGLGPYVAHRTGHGIGLEIHEFPWISRQSHTLLEEGMTFSVEPGIYIPNAFGVRLETVVVVEATGCRLLTPAPPENLPVVPVGGD